MIKEALEYLIGLKRPETVEVEGRDYATCNLTPVKEPEPKTVVVHTLTAMMDYLKSRMDTGVVCAGKKSTVMVHVETEGMVHLVSKLGWPFLQRNTYMTAQLIMESFPFGKFMEIESFVIALQSRFLPGGNRDEILKIAGNISDGVVATFMDDGITQEVSTRAGATLKGKENLPNPVMLMPFRTFHEVNQPQSMFVLRARKGVDSAGGLPTMALFEADGGAWKNEAINNIRNWFQAELPEAVIIA